MQYPRTYYPDPDRKWAGQLVWTEEGRESIGGDVARLQEKGSDNNKDGKTRRM